ncbi:MAG: CbiX/SirB N-terminal domain-containing protein [Terrimicrobiaceae bacterium]|nr:CbiX/SirB N-terminal domain-containing protein [Terrimicrobiaceae bacterium]
MRRIHWSEQTDIRPEYTMRARAAIRDFRLRDVRAAAHRKTGMQPKPGSALVIAGHGSTLNPDSSAPMHDHADAIRARGIFGEVAVCFWKEEPSLREVLGMVESRDVYVVPDFISEGYFTRTVIPRELDLAGPVTMQAGRTIKYCEPVGSHPRMTGVLLHRAAETAPDAPAEDTCLIIVGHGTPLNDNSAAAAKEQVRRIAALGSYAEVLAAYMEEPPLIAEWDRLTRCPNVVVVPFFIADGLHSFQDIPVLLGIEEEGLPAASQRDIFRRNPHAARGRRLYYASAVGTEPLLADVILDQVAAFDAAHA